jgi:hypothetical protein
MTNASFCITNRVRNVLEMILDLQDENFISDDLNYDTRIILLAKNKVKL